MSPQAGSKRALPWMLVSIAAGVVILAQNREIRRSSECFIDSAAEKFRFEVGYFGLKYTGESGNLIDGHVLKFGAFEKPELFLLKRLVADRKDIVFLDIGANTGLYSLFMAPLASRVHAVEPYPPILTKLRYNIEQNNLDNVEVHPVGFGDKKAVLPFHAPPNSNHGVGSFSLGFSEAWRESPGQENHDGELPIEVGDQYLRSRGIEHVDIIKLDIEGYEKLALRGLHGTLDGNRPFVLMELNTRNAEGFHSMEELQASFPAGYDFFEIRTSGEDLQTGRSELKALVTLPSRQLNIIAAPKERDRALLGI